MILGPNGSGKTTFLEAAAYLGTQRSFRGGPREALVRTGEPSCVIRAELEREGRPLLVEAEVATAGPSRTLVNHHPVRARAELARTVPTTVFAPGDLAVVQGAPQQRRDLLDDALRLVDPAAGAALDDLDRILRQRGALLRQCRGRLGPDAALTLDVWDDRLDRAGTAVGAARCELLEAVLPGAAEHYRELAGDGTRLEAAYRASWTPSLAEALAAARDDDVRRAVSTVGPHRDDIAVLLAGRDTRTQASQGEQRCVALSLRLAVHEVVAERTGVTPLLLLDDVFSELDPRRSAALVRLLPRGQCLLTTATGPPEGVAVDRLVTTGPEATA